MKNTLMENILSKKNESIFTFIIVEFFLLGFVFNYYNE